MHKWWC